MALKNNADDNIRFACVWHTGARQNDSPYFWYFISTTNIIAPSINLFVKCYMIFARSSSSPYPKALVHSEISELSLVNVLTPI